MQQWVSGVQLPPQLAPQVPPSQPQVPPSDDIPWVTNSDGPPGEDTGPKLGQVSPWTPMQVVPPSPSAPQLPAATAPPTPPVTSSTVTPPVASDWNPAADRGDLPGIFVPPSYPPIDTWPTAGQSAPPTTSLPSTAPSFDNTTGGFSIAPPLFSPQTTSPEWRLFDSINEPLLPLYPQAPGGDRPWFTSVATTGVVRSCDYLAVDGRHVGRRTVSWPVVS
jgi:hypothetical protein